MDGLGLHIGLSSVLGKEGLINKVILVYAIKVLVSGGRAPILLNLGTIYSERAASRPAALL